MILFKKMEDTLVNKINENTNWEDLLKIINKEELEKKYTNYRVRKSLSGGYLLTEKDKKDNNTIFLFNEKTKLKIFIEDKEEIIEVYSSLEIEHFIKSKNYELKDLFIKDTDLAYLDRKNYLNYSLKNKELEIKKKKKISILLLKEPLKSDLDYTPEEYSPYFYEYFIYEDKSKKNSKFTYMKSKTRDIIEDNIFELLRNKDIKEYKLTGPTSIGKSFTLFRISHIFINCIYVNLKVLNKKKEDLYLCYSIIISELERLDLKKNELNKLNEIIQDNYSNNKKYLDLLLNIVKYISKIEGLTIIVILDQFKNKYILY